MTWSYPAISANVMSGRFGGVDAGLAPAEVVAAPIDRARSAEPQDAADDQDHRQERDDAACRTRCCLVPRSCGDVVGVEELGLGVRDARRRALDDGVPLVAVHLVEGARCSTCTTTLRSGPARTSSSRPDTLVFESLLVVLVSSGIDNAQTKSPDVRMTRPPATSTPRHRRFVPSCGAGDGVEWVEQVHGSSRRARCSPSAVHPARAERPARPLHRRPVDRPHAGRWRTKVPGAAGR